MICLFPNNISILIYIPMASCIGMHLSSSHVIEALISKHTYTQRINSSVIALRGICGCLTWFCTSPKWIISRNMHSYCLYLFIRWFQHISTSVTHAATSVAEKWSKHPNVEKLQPLKWLLALKAGQSMYSHTSKCPTSQLLTNMQYQSRTLYEPH